MRTAVSAMRWFSPAATRILVVDNGSTDGSRAWLAGREDVRVLRLPTNLGHEVAQDLGFLSARTEFVISLDVDAFPISDRWLDELVTPLEAGESVSGAHVKGGFVHPCCLAMRHRDFVERNHTFVAASRRPLGRIGRRGRCRGMGHRLEHLAARDAASPDRPDRGAGTGRRRQRVRRRRVPQLLFDAIREPEAEAQRRGSGARRRPRGCAGSVGVGGRSVPRR